MSHGDLIWCDLSAYDPGTACAFYTDLLGWRWSENNGTHLAWLGNEPVASLYQMPRKFVDMGMPSFWMSYMAVDSAENAVERAVSLGGKVELGPQPFDGDSQIALIRDPLGAGFTVIDNPPSVGASHGNGARFGHALFVSDAARVAPFYSGLFGWRFEASTDGVYPVHHNGELLFHCHEIPDPAIRGEEQYWAVLFACDKVKAIQASKDTLLAEFDLPEGQSVLALDPQGAAFVTVEGAHG